MQIKTKQTYFTVEPGINYVTHLYTLAQAGFWDQDYLEKYGDSLSAGQLKYLREHGDLFSFHRRDHGPFAEFLYFAPAFFNLDTKQKLSDYFSAWNEAVELKRERPFVKYSRDPEHLREFFQIDEQTWENEILPLDRVFVELGRIFTANFANYKRHIWPKVRPILVERAEELNGQIVPGLIESWERLTGFRFSGQSYAVVLYFAGRSGPTWNDLSASKNSVFYDHKTEDMLSMLSHEIGIHLLLPRLREQISRNEQDIARLEKPGLYGIIGYMAFESLAAFYNEILSEGALLTGQETNDYHTFKQIYRGLYKAGLGPSAMYNKGVRQYSAMQR